MQGKQCCLTERVVREFSEGDVHPCAQLFAQVFSSAPWSEDWTPEKAQDYIQNAHRPPGFLGSVTVSGEELLAAAFGGFSESDSTKSFRIAEIFVRPDCQRRGIGGTLLDHLTCQVEERGATHLIATTLVLVDTPAAAFYLKHGFESKGAVPYNPQKHTFEKSIIP